MLNKLIAGLLITLITSTSFAEIPVHKVTTHHSRPMYSDVSIYVRSLYKGAKPRIEKVGENTFKVKFLYKNELKRMILKFKVK